MKRSITTVVLLLSALLAFASGTQEHAGTTIGISKMLSHPALDAIEQGIVDTLGQSGLSVAIEVQNANGEIATASAIAHTFKDAKKDIVVGIATPPAQALAQVFTDRPVVFAAITDPIGAGLVSSYQPSPGSNICGVSDMIPVDEQIGMLAELTQATRIGVVYAGNEANAVTLLQLAKQACDKRGITLVAASVSNSAEVRTAALSIIDRVDAMYVGTDNTVVSALASLSSVCSQYKVPLFSGDTTSSQDADVLAAWGFDYYRCGIACAKVIEQVINGADPGSLGTTFLTDPSEFELWINLDVADALGIEIPQDILNQATKVIATGTR